MTHHLAFDFSFHLNFEFSNASSTRYSTARKFNWTNCSFAPFHLLSKSVSCRSPGDLSCWPTSSNSFVAPSRSFKTTPSWNLVSGLALHLWCQDCPVLSLSSLDRVAEIVSTANISRWLYFSRTFRFGVVSIVLRDFGMHIPQGGCRRLCQNFRIKKCMMFYTAIYEITHRGSSPTR